MFQRSIRRGRMSQAYLFVGPAGVGKREFARRLSQCLLCQTHSDDELEACGHCPGCAPLLAGSHPDFLQVGCPAGKRELPVEVFLGSREKRGREGLCHALSLQPVAGNRKLAIIDDADLMNDASGNALLKTLEEPPPGTTLILIAANLDALLPTIRSRTQLIRFSPLRTTELLSLLERLGLLAELDPRPDIPELLALLELADGSLELAKIVLDPRVQSVRRSLLERLDEPRSSGTAIAKLLQENLELLGGETSDQRRTVQLLMRFVLEHARQQLQPQAADAASTIAAAARGSRDSNIAADQLESWGRVIDRATAVIEQVDANGSVPLIVEAFGNEVPQLLRL